MTFELLVAALREVVRPSISTRSFASPRSLYKEVFRACSLASYKVASVAITKYFFTKYFTLNTFYLKKVLLLNTL